MSSCSLNLFGTVPSTVEMVNLRRGHVEGGSLEDDVPIQSSQKRPACTTLSMDPQGQITKPRESQAVRICTYLESYKL
jgi:hypothetical protein